MLVNTFLFFYLLALIPRLFFRKKLHLFERLFLTAPTLKKGSTIWIHAVSVGEIKAAQPLFQALRRTYPDFSFLITTTTDTGRMEAKRALSGADCYRLIPLDFSWRVRSWVKKLQPKFFFLIESDFWPNLLSELQKAKVQTILVSGKMSERSFRRFSFFSSWAKNLFSKFDLLCVQNEEHKNRFLPFVSTPSALHITGNLKFDLEPVSIDLPFWRSKLALPQKTVVLSCTHPSEEELILNVFPLDDFFLLIAPRHPERFERVAQLLIDKKIPFFRWSSLKERRGDERVLLVDAMGQLPIIYSLSRLAILGGSYTNRVGGHNILEPALYGTPVFFGPHMFRQGELKSYLLQTKAAKQLPVEELRSAICHFFDHPEEESQMRQSAKELALVSKEVVKKTLALIEEK